MRDLLQSRFGGSWDGDAPEIHGLVTLGGRSLKVELLFVKGTGRWQVAIFSEGEVLALSSGEEPVMLVAQGLAEAMR